MYNWSPYGGWYWIIALAFSTDIKLCESFAKHLVTFWLSYETYAYERG